MIRVPYLHKLFNKFLNDGIHDSYDGLTSSIPALFCIFFALISSGRQYIGRPITCWTPREFRLSWKEYAHQYCFIQSTYPVSFDAELYPSHHDRAEIMHNMYQWVPVIFFLQAIILFSPNWIWKIVYRGHDMRIKFVIKKAVKALDADEEMRLKIFRNATFPMVETIQLMNKKTEDTVDSISGRRLAVFYLAMKVLRLVINLAMFWHVASLLHFEDSWWPIKALFHPLSNRNWENSPAFPRVTMCDFQVFQLANVITHTSQCLLMLNAINEKMFLLQLCMFLVTSFIGVYSIVNWAICLTTARRVENITHWLKTLKGKSLIINQKKATRFVEAIGLDGYFILWMVEKKTGIRIVSGFTRVLFETLQKIVRKKNKKQGTPLAESTENDKSLPSAPLQENSL